MMRAYTLSVLQRLAKSDKPISDPEIVEWANTTLSEAGKTSSITGFKDPSIATSMPVIDLVDAIKPGSIKYDLVNQGAALSDEVSDGTDCCLSVTEWSVVVLYDMKYHSLTF